MPATISSSGTWTTVSFTTTDIEATDPNTTKMSDIDFSASLRDTDLSELSQFIQLVATAYSIGFWPAVVLIDNALQIMRNRGVPSNLAGNSV
ncbi:MAG: hypothetical protein ACXADF_17135 [Candidatus Thorarchaeota archaeon]|jgi:hypothetical protein